MVGQVDGCGMKQALTPTEGLGVAGINQLIGAASFGTFELGRTEDAREKLAGGSTAFSNQ